MALALLECKHPFRLVLLEGAGHSLLEFWAEHQDMTRDWLDRYVRNRAPLPDTEPHDP